MDLRLLQRELGSGMVGRRAAALKLIRVEIDFAQVPRGVSLSLVVKMLRSGISALTTRSHRFRSDAFAKFDDGDKAVSARAVPPL